MLLEGMYDVKGFHDDHTFYLEINISSKVAYTYKLSFAYANLKDSNTRFL